MSERAWSSERLRAGTPSHKLAVVLEQRGMGALTLAKLLYPEHQVEDGRKTVRRWLNGSAPSRASRASIEAVLGLPEKSLDPDEDVEQALMRELLDTKARFDRIADLIEARA